MNSHDQQANNVFELATRMPHAMHGPQQAPQADPFAELFPEESPDVVRLAFAQFLQDQTSEIPRVPGTTFSSFLPQRPGVTESLSSFTSKVRISLEDLKNNTHKRTAFLGAIAAMGVQKTPPPLTLRSVPKK